MIPKLLHYVWVGPEALPEVDRHRIGRWRQLHPDWELLAWGNRDVDFSSRYLRGAFALRAWHRVSDYTRMDVLARYGGIYLDTDFDLTRPLDRFTECEAFLGFQAGDELPGELVASGLFGAARGHWLPTSIRNHFNERLDGRTDMNSFTGPGLVTQMLRERGLEGYSDDPVEVAGVTLLPKRYFYPYSWKEEYAEDVITPDTYAVHRWAATWVDENPDFRQRLRQKVLNRLGRHTPDLALQLSRYVAWRGTRTVSSGLLGADRTPISRLSAPRTPFGTERAQMSAARRVQVRRLEHEQRHRSADPPPICGLPTPSRVPPS